jgi:hypothetical protein
MSSEERKEKWGDGEKTLLCLNISMTEDLSSAIEEFSVKWANFVNNKFSIAIFEFIFKHFSAVEKKKAKMSDFNFNHFSLPSHLVIFTNEMPLHLLIHFAQTNVNYCKHESVKFEYIFFFIFYFFHHLDSYFPLSVRKARAIAREKFHTWDASMEIDNPTLYPPSYAFDKSAYK